MKQFDHIIDKGTTLDMAKLSEMSEAYGISPQLILQRNRGDFALPTLQEFASGATFKFQKKSKLKIPTSLNRKMEMGSRGLFGQDDCHSPRNRAEPCQHDPCQDLA